MIIYNILIRSLKDNIKNRYLIIMIIVLSALGLTLVSIGSSFTGNLKVDKLTIQVASMSSLSIFLIPLMALFISYDSIVGEKEQGRLLLYLSYPISKFEWIIGKFLGDFIAIIISIFIGYLITILPILFTSKLSLESLYSFLRLIFSSILLGGVFVAIGYIISASVKQRSSAVGISIGIWLMFVMLFDLSLLGLLTSEFGGKLSSNTINIILLLNPIDIFRLMSLSAEQMNNYSAMQAVGNVNSLSFTFLVLVMLLWLITPLILAIYKFKNIKI